MQTIHFEINKLSSVPLHEQLRLSIKTAILNGTYGEGHQLPTEEFLCDFYNISRPVVRRAYQALINEGIVERYQGKGTFVKVNLMLSNLVFAKDYNQFIQEHHMTPTTHLLILDRVTKYDIPTLIDEMYIDYYSIKRIRLANSIPIMYENYYLPVDLFPDLPKEVNENLSFTEYVKDKLKLKTLKSTLHIKIKEADDKLVAIFDCIKGEALFKFIEYQRSSTHQLCFHKIAYFPGRHHCIDMRAD